MILRQVFPLEIGTVSAGRTATKWCEPRKVSCNGVCEHGLLTMASLK